MQNYKDLLVKILLKKAKGYLSREKTEEFVFTDGQKVAVKQRITTKQVPPDVSANKSAFGVAGRRPCRFGYDRRTASIGKTAANQTFERGRRRQHGKSNSKSNINGGKNAKHNSKNHCKSSLRRTRLQKRSRVLCYEQRAQEQIFSMLGLS